MTERIASLDLMRGVAVLGILAVNVAAFAGPTEATLSPRFPFPAGPADQAFFATVFVLFEGKMRALFTLLFGASMMLFIDRAEEAGRDGPALQARRLGWLLLFGYAHFALLWSGDILFLYALLGFLGLSLREIPLRQLATGALFFFLLWHLAGALSLTENVVRAEAVRLGAASPAAIRAELVEQKAWLDRSLAEIAAISGSYTGLVRYQISQSALQPLTTAFSSFGETVPLMLLGQVLYRSGFFTGGWSHGGLARLAIGGLLFGLGTTLPILAWCWARDFPVGPMLAVIVYWTAPAHLAMALAYAALLVRFAPRVLATRLGARLVAAGRMAFSNYIGTSLVMCFLFYGWGLGLAPNAGPGILAGAVSLGWGLMLAWSEPWLARFRHGPLEWAWRSLTEGRALPFRR